MATFISQIKAETRPMLGRTRKLAQRGRVHLWARFNRVAFVAGKVRWQHKAALEVALWVIVVTLGAFSEAKLQRLLNPLVDANVAKSLQTLVATVGGAIIGATAILSSFVLFAMQVNVERLPYRLFSRFSSDWRLLSSFAASFIVAIAGTSLSLNSAPERAASVILMGIGAVALVLRLLFHAYRRALDLVNPVHQLGMVYAATKRQLNRWDRRVRWMSVLCDQSEGADSPLGIDQRRAAILRANPTWDRQLRDAIDHSVAFARRAGEAGDLEVSATALNTVIALNRLYVQAKGRTFHADVPLIQNPLVTDGVINGVLEDLRQLRDVALARQDEPQTEQVFRTLVELVRTYAAIPYPPHSSLTHALLATAYLERSVEAAVRHEMTDTVMNGVRALGDAAGIFLSRNRPNEMTGIAKKIGYLGTLGAIKEESRPITLIAMEQLSDLSLTLLRVDSTEVRYAAREVMDAINLLAKLFLNLPDAPLQSAHSTYLGPFYSGTSFTSFRARLTPLINALLEADTDNAAATKFANNLALWADGLYVGQKELLLLAIEKRSHFTFDIIHWITDISDYLLAASRAPATQTKTREELERHADWLFATLTWIPRNLDTARFVETFQLIEEVFEHAMTSAGREWQRGFDASWRFLLNWGFEAGRDHTGWSTLERALTALTALALRPGENRAELLKSQVSNALAAAISPSREIRDQTARALRERAQALRANEFEFNLIERVLVANDRDATRTLLRDLAEILTEAAAPPAVEGRCR